MATTYFASSQVTPAVLQSKAGGGPTSTVNLPKKNDFIMKTTLLGELS